ncbi:MAG: protein kinase, partial [Deltaproteobacteria bacterium]
TTTGMPGTPLFMAPELLQGGTATFRADIYSAAATIYRMLTGHHPIEAKKLNEWLQAIQTQVPPPANSIREDIPQQISDALAKALSKKPQDRQEAIAELAADLGL